MRREIALLEPLLPPDSLSFAAGGRALRARAVVQEWAQIHGIDRLVSVGIAGGVALNLPPGTVIVPRAVIAPDGRIFMTDRFVSESIAAKLPNAARGDLIGVDAPVTTVVDKAALFRRHGALACDMESHGAAVAAAEFKIPFACLRVIADPASRALPAAALAGLGPDGEIRGFAVLRALLARPREIVSLAALAADMRKAMAALRKAVAVGALLR